MPELPAGTNTSKHICDRRRRHYRLGRYIRAMFAADPSHRKANAMQLYPILQGESLKRLIQGFGIGAFVTMFIGFVWGGWVTSGTAWKMAQRDAKDAMISALAPICVDKFQNQPDAEKNMSTLKMISLWQQASFIERGGWATMPGATASDMGVAQACAEMLGKLKVVGQR